MEDLAFISLKLKSLSKPFSKCLLSLFQRLTRSHLNPLPANDVLPDTDTQKMEINIAAGIFYNHLSPSGLSVEDVSRSGWLNAAVRRGRPRIP